MSILDRYLKVLIVFVWGAAITLRAVDLREVLAERTYPRFVPSSVFAASAVQVDAFAILMSLVIVIASFVLLGRVRKSWLLLCVMIVVSKAITIAGDAGVGDLPVADLTMTSLTTFLLPAGVIVLLVRSRHLLETEGALPARERMIPRSQSSIR